MKPISPGPRESIATIFGVSTPTRSIVYFASVPIMRMVWPLLMRPSMTRTRTMTPR